MRIGGQLNKRSARQSDALIGRIAVFGRQLFCSTLPKSALRRLPATVQVARGRTQVAYFISGDIT
jgi:hypothetical protein